MSTEFDAIFIIMGGDRPVMSQPPPVQASSLFIREVQDALDLPDDKATAAADWIANKMERFGARTAEPIFDMDGNGPQCSWCSAIWPLCGHHHMSIMLDDDEDNDDEVEVQP